MSAVHQFYDRLIQLPLDEKTLELFSCDLITACTLEREFGRNRAVKNRFILQEVIETVQQNPDRLDTFCSLLPDVHIAKELTQRFRGIYALLSKDAVYRHEVAFRGVARNLNRGFPWSPCLSLLDKKPMKASCNTCSIVTY